MKAILLAGGFATRMQPVSLRTPKVLLPIGGKPGMQLLVELCREGGVKEIVVALSVSQKKIEDFFGDGFRYGVKMSYVYEDTTSDENKLGAIGALQQVAAKLKLREDVVVIGSDNYVSGLDLKTVLKSHASSKAAATIVLNQLTDRRLVEQFGVAVLDNKGRIKQFQEKPRVEEALSALASTAIYVLSNEFLTKYVPAYVEAEKKQGRKADRLGDLWQYHVSKLHLNGYVFSGYWGDTNNAQTYTEANKLAMNSLQSKVESRCDGLVTGTGVRIGRNVKVAKGAVIKGPVILEDGVSVGKDAIVGPYVHLMTGCSVGEGAFLNGVVAFEKTRLGAYSRCENSILDGEVSIGDRARLEQFCVLGYGVDLGSNVRLLSNTRIWPFTQVKADSVAEGVFKIPEHFFATELQKRAFRR